MYDVLDLYEEDYDPKNPIICLDEKPKQLLGDKRIPIPMKPGSSEKYDYEYVRNQSCAGAPRCKQRGMLAPPLEIPLKEIVTLNGLV